MLPLKLYPFDCMRSGQMMMATAISTLQHVPDTYSTVHEYMLLLQICSTRTLRTTSSPLLLPTHTCTTLRTQPSTATASSVPLHT